MQKHKEPDGSRPDFMRGLLYSLPISIALWCLILVIGAGLGWVINHLIEDLLLTVHVKLFLALTLIFVGLFSLERILRPPTRKP